LHSGQIVKANFISFHNGIFYFQLPDNSLHQYHINDFAPQDQKFLQFKIRQINNLNDIAVNNTTISSHTAPTIQYSISTKQILLTAVIGGLFCFLIWLKK